MPFSHLIHKSSSSPIFFSFNNSLRTCSIEILSHQNRLFSVSQRAIRKSLKKHLKFATEAARVGDVSHCSVSIVVCVLCNSTSVNFCTTEVINDIISLRFVPGKIQPSSYLPEFFMLAALTQLDPPLREITAIQRLPFRFRDS